MRNLQKIEGRPRIKRQDCGGRPVPAVLAEVPNPCLDVAPGPKEMNLEGNGENGEVSKA